MAAFITEGNRVIPASLTAITNGDASAPLIFPINHGWLYGTNKPLVANETRQNIVISLSTCLVAFGNVSLWFAVSAEVRPTNLVPENEIVVVTKTEEKPWKPFLNAQNSCQNLPPIYSLFNPVPPTSILIHRIQKPVTATILVAEKKAPLRQIPQHQIN